MSPSLRATAPCRIDFAGGTLDLWPLCAFMGEVFTLNHAISLRPSITFTPIDGDRNRVKSQDLGLELLVQPKTPELSEGPLALFALALRALPPEQSYELTIHSPVPKGSGLGASSTLLIATLAGLSKLRGEERKPADMVALARDLEARLIGVPTGTQDYWAAVNGGLLAIQYSPGQNVGAPIPGLGLGDKLSNWLSERLFVLYSGEAHFSAAPNWSMLKAYIEDARGPVRVAFKEVLAATHDGIEAIRNDDPEQLEAAIRREWAARKTLSEAVCPPRIAEVMKRLEDAGASSMKLCGAGGGGSMICLVPPERQEHFSKTVEEYGLTDLKGRLETSGVTVEEI